MGKLKVLIVDDEEELVFTVVERLGFRGIDAEGAVSGAEALTMMQQKEYDVVVVDVKMPGIGGLEALRRIRKDHPAVPVILITGHGSARDGELGLAEGAFEYLAKPVQLEEMIKKMREAAAIKKAD